MYTSHQRPSYSYPHHTRYPQQTSTPTPIPPDALSTQTHLPPSHQMPLAHKHTYPHHTRCPNEVHNHSYPYHTRRPTTTTHITPDQYPQHASTATPHHTRCTQYTTTATYILLHRPKSLSQTTYLVGRVPT